MSYQITIYSEQEKEALNAEMAERKRKMGWTPDHWCLSVKDDGTCSFPSVILGSHLSYQQKKNCLVSFAKNCKRSDSDKRGMSREEWRCVWFGTENQYHCYYRQPVSQRLNNAVIRQMQREGYWA